MKGRIITGLFDNGLWQLSGDLIFRAIIKQKMKKRRAKPWTRSVIYISIVSRFSSNRCRNRGFQTIPFLYAGDLILFFLLEQYFAKYSWFRKQYVADLAMITPLTIWNLLGFRVTEKKKTAKTIYVRSALVITSVVSLPCNSSYFESY